MNLATVINRSRKDRESWRYTDIEKLLAKSDSSGAPPPLAPPSRGGEFDRPRDQTRSSPLEGEVRWVGVTPETDSPVHPRLVFIDGVLVKEQSQFGDLPPGIVSGDARHGYRITIEGQTCLVTQPVELLFRATPNAPAEIAVRLHITLGASGRLSLLERHEKTEAEGRRSEVGENSPASGLQPLASPVHIMETEITLHPQAKLVHGKIIRDDTHIGLTNVSIAEGAYYDNFTLIRGGKLSRNEIEAKLTGPLAQCALNGLMLLSGNDHADTVTRTIHAASDGTSRQLYKTVAGGKARGVFQGKIIVEKGADKTDGQQLSRALLLSDQAEVDAKPELEISADDVKCSHGCAVGNLDADALFYLRARGLNEVEARALLIRAFAEETLDAIHIPEWRDAFGNELGAWCDEQD